MKLSKKTVSAIRFAAVLSLLVTTGMVLAGNGYGPGDGTGEGPQDGTGNGPATGDCTAGINFTLDNSFLLAGNGNGSGGGTGNGGNGHGPGDGSRTGEGPEDGTGNGPGTGVCINT